MKRNSLAALPLALAFAIAGCGSDADEQPVDEFGETATIEERAETWNERADDAGTGPQDPAFPLDDNAKRAEQLEDHAEAIQN